MSDRDHGRLPALLLSLTLLSGMIDAVSVLRLGNVFVANMTGNLLFIGLALVRGTGFSLSSSLIAFGGFAVGARACRPWFRIRPEPLAELRGVSTCQAVLLAVAATLSGTAGGTPTGASRYAVIAVCGVAMGGQNAVARRMGVSELTTTVMTGTLVGLLSRPSQSGVTQVRQALGILVLVAGAVLSAELLRISDTTVPLAVAAGIASAVALATSRECHRVLRS